MEEQQTVHNPSERGFTLIETMVALVIFSFVVSAVISLVTVGLEANRRSRTEVLVFSNLNAAIQSMARTIRVGTYYYCTNNVGARGNALQSGSLPRTQDCGPGSAGALFAFESSRGDLFDIDDQVVYRFIAPSGPAPGRIERSIDAGYNYVPLTSSQLNISDMRFNVVGSTPGDSQQPRILIRIIGEANLGHGSYKQFNVQTTVTQRLIDL